MPLPAEFQPREATDLDTAEIFHFADGRQEIRYAPSKDEVERLRVAREAEAAERHASEARAAVIQRKVSEYVSKGPGATKGIVDTDAVTPAQAALLKHIEWMARTQELVASARAKHEHVAAVVRQAAQTRASLERHNETVARDVTRWLTFDGASVAAQPANGSDERDRLSAQLRDLDVVASHQVTAAVELEAAEGAMAALDDLLTDLRGARLVEAAMAALQGRAADLHAQTQGLYGSMASLKALGVAVGKWNFHPDEKVQMPSAFPSSRPVQLLISETESDAAAWRTALEAIKADPLATIVVPGAAQTESKPQPAPRRGLFKGKR